MELRYMGFDQSQGTRAFRFEIASKGEGARQAVVTAEMDLFLQFHVAIQEGPTLCVRKLASDLAISSDEIHTLTAGDLRAYVESQAETEARRLELRAAGGRRHNRPHATSDKPLTGM